MSWAQALSGIMAGSNGMNEYCTLSQVADLFDYALSLSQTSSQLRSKTAMEQQDQQLGVEPPRI